MDLLFHLLIPYALLRLAGYSDKYLVPLSFFAVLPDLDRFAWARHSAGHSLFVGAALLAVVWLLTRKRPDGRRVTFITGFYFFSHLALDLGEEMAWFWPFDKTYYVVEPYVRLVNLWPTLGIDFTTLQTVQQGIGGVLGGPGFGVLALLAVLVAVKGIRKK